jgi:hypothetical protein
MVAAAYAADHEGEVHAGGFGLRHPELVRSAL